MTSAHNDKLWRITLFSVLKIMLCLHWSPRQTTNLNLSHAQGHCVCQFVVVWVIFGPPPVSWCRFYFLFSRANPQSTHSRWGPSEKVGRCAACDCVKVWVFFLIHSWALAFVTFVLQKAIAPASCLVLLNEHPLLKYSTSRSVAKHPVGESLKSGQIALEGGGALFKISPRHLFSWERTVFHVRMCFLIFFLSLQV